MELHPHRRALAPETERTVFLSRRSRIRRIAIAGEKPVFVGGVVETS
jgi:hypothetical protein